MKFRRNALNILFETLSEYSTEDNDSLEKAYQKSLDSHKKYTEFNMSRGQAFIDIISLWQYNGEPTVSDPILDNVLRSVPNADWLDYMQNIIITYSEHAGITPDESFDRLFKIISQTVPTDFRKLLLRANKLEPNDYENLPGWRFWGMNHYRSYEELKAEYAE